MAEATNGMNLEKARYDLAIGQFPVASQSSPRASWADWDSGCCTGNKGKMRMKVGKAKWEGKIHSMTKHGKKLLTAKEQAVELTHHKNGLHALQHSSVG